MESITRSMVRNFKVCKQKIKVSPSGSALISADVSKKEGDDDNVKSIW